MGEPKYQVDETKITKLENISRVGNEKTLVIRERQGTAAGGLPIFTRAVCVPYKRRI